MKTPIEQFLPHYVLPEGICRPSEMISGRPSNLLPVRRGRRRLPDIRSTSPVKSAVGPERNAEGEDNLITLQHPAYLSSPARWSMPWSTTHSPQWSTIDPLSTMSPWSIRSPSPIKSAVRPERDVEGEALDASRTPADVDGGGISSPAQRSTMPWSTTHSPQWSTIAPLPTISPWSVRFASPIESAVRPERDAKGEGLDDSWTSEWGVFDPLLPSPEDMLPPQPSPTIEPWLNMSGASRSSSSLGPNWGLPSGYLVEGGSMSSPPQLLPLRADTSSLLGGTDDGGDLGLPEQEPVTYFTRAPKNHAVVKGGGTKK